MAKPKVSIIILHLRDTAGLIACLSSLRALAYPDFEIILVHNGPPDPALDALAAAFPGGRAEALHTGRNAGFAAGNNAGIRRALGKGAEYVLLLNDDTEVSPGFLDLLVEEAEKDPAAGMLGPQILYLSEPGRIAFAGAGFDQASCSFSFPHADEPCAESGGAAPYGSDYITGCALLVKRAVLEKIGLLDERFFLYWEDGDWGLRAGKAGYRCLVVPAARIWHKVSASSGGNDSPFKAYHKAFSRLLFCDLHAPEAKRGVLRGFARDVVWLLLKSGRGDRLEKAWAYISAAAAHYGWLERPAPAVTPSFPRAAGLLALVAAGAAFFLYFGIYKMFAVNFGIQGQDFMHGYHAANNFFSGRSIYEMPPPFTPYPYFPPATLLFMPFAWLPGDPAKTLWLLCGLALTALSFRTLYGFGRGGGKLASAAAASGALLLSTPLYQMLFTGNLNVFIFTALVLVYAALLGGRRALVAPAFALFAVVKIFPALLMGFFARRLDLRAWAAFALTLCGAAVVSLALFGAADTSFYFRQLTGLTRFAGPIHSMSMTFIMKLALPQADAGLLLLPNLLLLAGLAAAWWRVSGKHAGRADGPGAAVTDLFLLTAGMILVMPYAWTFYCAFYAVPFYFALRSFLEGRRDFKLPFFFPVALAFLNLWEILYYHFPLAGRSVTPRVVEMARESYPALFPAVFSLHFLVNLALFFWALWNYRELAENIGRLRGAAGEPAATTRA